MTRMKGAMKRKVNEMKEKPVNLVKKDVTQEAPQDESES